jgi:hypothetical protein
VTRRSAPKGASVISLPSSIDHHLTARARLEAAESGLVAHLLNPSEWPAEDVIQAAIVLVDAALKDLAVVS